MGKFKIQKADYVNSGYNYNSPIGGTGGSVSFNGNQLQPWANIDGQEGWASILAQRGRSKFLVVLSATIGDESILEGSSYQIASLGTTDWKALGCQDPYVGKVFTAQKSGSGLTTNGTARRVGICELADGGEGAYVGKMHLGVHNYATNTDFKASRITNNKVYDFAGHAYSWSFTDVHTAYAAETNVVTIRSQYRA
jgi:hypothetical protein